MALAAIRRRRPTLFSFSFQAISKLPPPPPMISPFPPKWLRDRRPSPGNSCLEVPPLVPYYCCVPLRLLADARNTLMRLGSYRFSARSFRGHGMGSSCFLHGPQISSFERHRFGEKIEGWVLDSSSNAMHSKSDDFGRVSALRAETIQTTVICSLTYGNDASLSMRGK